jgi:hypothetical protein
LLNAGTTLSAVGQDGSVGLGAQTLGRTDSAGAVEVAGVEVAGVTVGDGAAGGAARTVSTAGEPSLAALLNTATSVSGLGPSGAVATGITGFEG